MANSYIPDRSDIVYLDSNLLMEQVAVGRIIDKARLDLTFELDLSNKYLSSLPGSVGNFKELINLNLFGNKLTSLPEFIGFVNLKILNLSYNQLTRLPNNVGDLFSLRRLFLCGNKLKSLPNDIGNLLNLNTLGLNENQLVSLPDAIGNLIDLTTIHLAHNQLTSLPNEIANLVNLRSLYLQSNKLTSLPESFSNLSNLFYLDLNDNPLVDLSVIQNLENLETVNFLGVVLPRRYWTKFSEWKPKWLLDENNAEIRRVLIEEVGYEKICKELNAVILDTWREYTLLEIAEIEAIYSINSDEDDEPIDREPMVLIKMICPSTQHIHILRVPPEMTSAEAAITWVNHGIHPDEFALQT